MMCIEPKIAMTRKKFHLKTSNKNLRNVTKDQNISTNTIEIKMDIFQNTKIINSIQLC